MSSSSSTNQAFQGNLNPSKSRDSSPPVNLTLPVPLALLSPSMQRALGTIVVYAVAAYVIWVLFGVVAWVTYLGADAEAVGLEVYFDFILPGGADPGRMAWSRKVAAAGRNNAITDPVNNTSRSASTAILNTTTNTTSFSTDLLQYLTKNLPLGILFVIQHSFFTVKRLRSPQFGSLSAGVARLTYCLCSAIILHLFMVYYRNDQPGSWMAKAILILPVSRAGHFYFSSACMGFAMIAFCRAPETWALLGVAQILGWNEQDSQEPEAQNAGSNNSNGSASVNMNSNTSPKSKKKNTKKKSREGSTSRGSGGDGKKQKKSSKKSSKSTRSDSLVRSVSDTGKRTASSEMKLMNDDEQPRVGKTLSESSMRYRVPGVGSGAKTRSGSDLAENTAESSKSDDDPDGRKSEDSAGSSDSTSGILTTSSNFSNSAKNSVSPDGIFSRLTDNITNRYRVPSVGMDAISWMGLTVVRLGGPLALIAFSGLSIIPYESTWGDLIVRATAAVYLRIFSKAFRDFIEEVEQWHALIWTIRGSICGFVWVYLWGELGSGGEDSAVGRLDAGSSTLEPSSSTWYERVHFEISPLISKFTVDALMRSGGVVRGVVFLLLGFLVVIVLRISEMGKMNKLVGKGFRDGENFSSPRKGSKKNK